MSDIDDETPREVWEEYARRKREIENGNRGRARAMTIESNIPIPERKPYVASPIRLALDEMKIGDSCWMPTIKRSVVQNVYTIAERMGMKVTTRLTVKDGQRGVRVWRVC